MKIISKNFKLLAVFLLVIGVTACGDDDDNNVIGILVTDVEDVISDNENLTILEEALELTNLDTVLENQSAAYTVFAPTDDAFVALLATNDDWNSLSDIPTTTLTAVLLNHVVGEELDATAVVNAGSGYLNTSSPTGFGDSTLSLYFNVDGSTVELNGGFDTAKGANVTTTDLRATNGVVHIINKVLLPMNIVDHALANDNFTTLVSALTTLTPATDFVSILSRTTANDDMIDPPFTVFAPVNAAFDAITVPAEDVLTQVLLHHVVGGSNVRSSALTPNGTTTAPTLQGQSIDITLPGTDGNIADVTDGAGNTDIGIVAVDVQTSNGVIHVLNKVMLPSLD